MARFQTLIVFEAFLIGALLALPAYWIRCSILEKRSDEGIYWKVLLSAFLFSLGAVSGLRVIQDGWVNSGADQMTCWFLPLMGTFYLHVRVTLRSAETAKIAFFLLLLSFPVAMARAKIGAFLFAMPE